MIIIQAAVYNNFGIGGNCPEGTVMASSTSYVCKGGITNTEQIRNCVYGLYFSQEH